jgi:hypothetical protein
MFNGSIYSSLSIYGGRPPLWGTGRLTSRSRCGQHRPFGSGPPCSRASAGHLMGSLLCGLLEQGHRAPVHGGSSDTSGAPAWSRARRRPKLISPHDRIAPMSPSHPWLRSIEHPVCPGGRRSTCWPVVTTSRFAASGVFGEKECQGKR